MPRRAESDCGLALGLLLDVDLAHALLLSNRLHLIANFVRQADLLRNSLDQHERRRRIGSVELDILDPAEPIKEGLLSPDVFDPIKFERVGHLTEDALRRFQTFVRHFVDSAFRLEIALRSDKHWHDKKDQDVRT